MGLLLGRKHLRSYYRDCERNEPMVPERVPLGRYLGFMQATTVLCSRLGICAPNLTSLHELAGMRSHDMDRMQDRKQTWVSEPELSMSNFVTSSYKQLNVTLEGKLSVPQNYMHAREVRYALSQVVPHTPLSAGVTAASTPGLRADCVLRQWSPSWTSKNPGLSAAFVIGNASVQSSIDSSKHGKVDITDKGMRLLTSPRRDGIRDVRSALRFVEEAVARSRQRLSDDQMVALAFFPCEHGPCGSRLIDSHWWQQ